MQHARGPDVLSTDVRGTTALILKRRFWGWPCSRDSASASESSRSARRRRTRKVATTGASSRQDCPAAAGNVAPDSAEVGDGAEGYPVEDVAAAGGWKTEDVLMTSYQLADAETIKNVVLDPTNRIVSR